MGGYLIRYSNYKMTVGTKETDLGNELDAVLYPNPTNNAFRINLSEEWQDIAVTVYDIAGNIVQGKFYSSAQSLKQANFDLSYLPNGMYFVKVQSEGKFTTMKVIKE